MTEEVVKRVLIVDDENHVRKLLNLEFTDQNGQEGCPYTFVVDEASSAKEGIKKIRLTEYDVVTLDVYIDAFYSGLALAHVLGEGYGVVKPIRIMFTGHAREIPNCVTAMRDGTWDYIVKEDVNDVTPFRRVVNSALHRLLQIDLRREQEKEVMEWSSARFHENEKEYGGQIIALWHKPDVHVIAHGRDVFEIEDGLKQWREEHKERPWEQPYLVQVLPVPGDYQVGE